MILDDCLFVLELDNDQAILHVDALLVDGNGVCRGIYLLIVSFKEYWLTIAERHLRTFVVVDFVESEVLRLNILPSMIQPTARLVDPCNWLSR